MRRVLSLLGIIVLIALALTLLWRVYVHHNAVDPYQLDEPATVRLDVLSSAPVKIAQQMR